MSDKPKPADDTEGLLSGVSVLLTRPALQGVNLRRKIEESGGQVVNLPLLEIDPLVDKPSIDRIKTQIMGLDQYDTAVFISTNAASLGMDWISQYWPQLPIGLEAYAVGPSTAEILRQFTWPVHVSTSGVTSEHLLALPGLQDMRGRRVALFRGQGGRELLADSLRERGARVQYIELYQRRVPNYDRQETLDRIASKGTNVAVLTSMQILESFLQLLGLRETGVSSDQESRDKADVALLSLLETLIVVVPSSRIKQIAEAAGFQHVIEASGADDESILRSLIRCRVRAEDM